MRTDSVSPAHRSALPLRLGGCRQLLWRRIRKGNLLFLAPFRQISRTPCATMASAVFHNKRARRANSSRRALFLYAEECDVQAAGSVVRQTRQQTTSPTSRGVVKSATLRWQVCQHPPAPLLRLFPTKLRFAGSPKRHLSHRGRQGACCIDQSSDKR